MRKADYAALAAAIARNVALVRKYSAPVERQAGERMAIAIAEEFARTASVDEIEFLKACGLRQ